MSINRLLELLNYTFRSANINEKIINEETSITASSEAPRFEVNHLKSKFHQLQNEHHKLLGIT